MHLQRVANRGLIHNHVWMVQPSPELNKNDKILECWNLILRCQEEVSHISPPDFLTRLSALCPPQRPTLPGHRWETSHPAAAVQLVMTGQRRVSRCFPAGVPVQLWLRPGDRWPTWPPPDICNIPRPRGTSATFFFSSARLGQPLAPRPWSPSSPLLSVLLPPQLTPYARSCSPLKAANSPRLLFSAAAAAAVVHVSSVCFPLNSVALSLISHTAVKVEMLALEASNKQA